MVPEAKPGFDSVTHGNPADRNARDWLISFGVFRVCVYAQRGQKAVERNPEEEPRCPPLAGVGFYVGIKN